MAAQYWRQRVVYDLSAEEASWSLFLARFTRPSLPSPILVSVAVFRSIKASCHITGQLFLRVPFLTWVVTVVVTVSGSDTTHNWSGTAMLTSQHSSSKVPVVWSSDKQLRNNQIAEPRTYRWSSDATMWLDRLSDAFTSTYSCSQVAHVQGGAV